MADAIMGLRVADTLTYGPETLISMKTTNNLFGSGSSPSVGNVSSAQIEITMKNVSDNIPKMAKLEPYVVVNGQTYKKGVFFIDTREVDSASDTIYDVDTLTINGYDLLLKTEQALYITEDADYWESGKQYNVNDKCKYNAKTYKCLSAHLSGDSFDFSKWEAVIPGSPDQWPKSDRAVVAIIADRIGLPLDSSLTSKLNRQYYVEYPGYGEEGYTMRQVLGYIGAMYAGNWYITSEGKLNLFQLNETRTTKIIDGYDECKSSKSVTYTRVTIDAGNGYVYTAGDSTGEELKFECPWGHQTMANNVLSLLNNFTYQPFEINEFVCDPSIYIGEKIKIEDKTSYIYNFKLNFDYLLTASASAPNGSESEHEYNFKDLGTKTVASELSKLKTSLIVQTGQITALISGEIKTYRSATDPSKSAGAVMHIGDIWYCTADTGSFNAGNMYRWSGDSWEEVSSTVNVAPNWEASTYYSKDDVVTYEGKWYKCLTAHTSTTSFDPSKWQQVENITQVAESKINQTIDNITLSVTSGKNGSKISLTSGGVTIDSALVDMHVKSVNIEGKIIADEIVANSTITSPTITAGGADAGVVEVSSSGINFGSRGDNLTIGLGYREVGSNHFPVIMMGQGIDASGTDQGMIKKYANGIWIGDNDDADYSSPGASRTSNGIFVDFQNGKIYKYINGAASELGSATFGE